MLLSPEDLNIFDSSALSPIKAKLNGARITVKNLSIGAENIAKLSAFSFAMLLGDISPNIRTATVMTTVEIVTPFYRKIFCEYYRGYRGGGYVYNIVPDKDRRQYPVVILIER